MGVMMTSRHADYLVVGDEFGETLWWENQGPDGKYGWAEQGVAATGPRQVRLVVRWTWP